MILIRNLETRQKNYYEKYHPSQDSNLDPLAFVRVSLKIKISIIIKLTNNLIWDTISSFRLRYKIRQTKSARVGSDNLSSQAAIIICIAQLNFLTLM